MNRRPTQLKRRALPGLVLLAALLGLVACEGERPDTAADGEQEPDPVRVETTQPERDTVVARYRTTASLQAIRDSQVRAETNGLLEEVRVREGDEVAAGDVLARVDDRRQQLEVERMRAELADLEQEYEQTAQLVEQGVESRDSAESLRHQVAARRAQLAVAELELTQATITAPFDGVVADRLVREGDYVSERDELFRLVDASELEARLNVPQRLYGHIEPGQPVAVRVETMPDREHQGVVDRIHPAVDADTGTLGLTVRVEAGDTILPPGSFARFAIARETREDAVLVPRQALRRDNGNNSLFVIDGETARHRAVDIGERVGDRVEIRRGLNGGEEVVLFGHSGLRDGHPVERVAGEDRLATQDDRE